MEENIQKSILLLGECGEGKSSLGNFLIGGNKFEEAGDINTGVTKKLQIESINPLLNVIDTPGIYLSQLYTKQIKALEEIKNVPGHYNISLILIIINFRRGNFCFGYEENILLNLICKIFPEDLKKHIGIVLNHCSPKVLNTKFNKKINELSSEVSSLIDKYSRKENELYFIDLNEQINLFFIDIQSGDLFAESEKNNILILAQSLPVLKKIDTRKLSKESYLPERLCRYINYHNIDLNQI